MKRFYLRFSVKSADYPSRKKPISTSRLWVTLVVVTLSGFCWASPLFSAPLPGDVDGDGKRSLSDVILTLRIATGLQPATPEKITLADVAPRPGTEGRLYGDGKVTIADAIRLLQFAVGLLSEQDLTPEENRFIYVLNAGPKCKGPAYLSLVDLFNLRTKQGEVVRLNLLPLGDIPNAMVSQGQTGYIVNSGSNTLQIVDLSALKTVGTVSLGEGTNPMQMALVGRRAYVTLLLTNEVAVVDLDKLEVSQRIPVGSGPTGIAYANNKVYVTNTNFQGFDPSTGVSKYGPGTVSVLDPLTNRVIKDIPVDINPQTILEDSRGRLHVVCTGNFGDIPGRINIIDPKTDTVVGRVDIGGAPGSLAFAFNGKAYLSDSLNGLTSYDFRALEILRPPSQALKVTPFPWAMVTDTRGNLYVSVLSTGDLLVLDTFKDEFIGRVGVGDCPEGLYIR